MKVIYKVVAISLLWVILITPFRLTTTGDDSFRLRMAHAWLTRTDEINLPTDYKPSSRIGNLSSGVIGKDGKRYITYDIGQSILMLPGNWLGIQLHKFFSAQNDTYIRAIVTRWVTFVPLNVALITACFWLLKLLNFSEKIAAVSSFTILLGTTVMHYIQSSQQNNQVLLFVVLAYGCSIVANQASSNNKNRLFLLLSGLAAGAAFLIRKTSLWHLITIFLFLIGGAFLNKKNIFQTFKTACIWALGVLPMVLIGRIVDYVRLGVFWQTAGQLSHQQKRLGLDPIFNGLPEVNSQFPFNNPPWMGIWGALFSPAKSIFIYDPLLLPCIFLGIIFWRKLAPYFKLYIVVNVLNLLLHLIFYSKLDFWHGDPAWGARYHVTSVHLLLIPLIGLLIQNLLAAKKLYLWSIRLLLTIAIAVQITSVVLPYHINSNQVYFATAEEAMEFRLAERIMTIGCLVNESFTADCNERIVFRGGTPHAEPLREKISFWFMGFTGKRPLALAIWSTLLVFAVIATWQLCLSLI